MSQPESTSAALRRAEQERDALRSENDAWLSRVIERARERDLARAELASARQELDAVRTARDRLDADLGAARARLVAVIKIHEKSEGRCVECVEYCECMDDTCTHGNVDWPCPTAVAGGFA